MQEKPEEKEKKKYGRIEFIMGPMYGGKSTELKRRIRRMVSAKKRCIIIKFDKDTRYQVTDDLRSSEHLLMTHDKESVPAMPAHNLTEVDRILEEMPPFDCIGIDEIQFFGDTAVPTLTKWRKEGKVVICAGLHTSAAKRMWPVSIALIEESDDMLFLPAVCKECSEEDAAFTWALTNTTGAVQIGGEEEYKPVCSSCYSCLEKQRHGTSGSNK